MATGWIKLHRQMLEWEWYQDINVKVLFIHLLLKANGTNLKFQGNEIKRGSLVTSVKSLSEQTRLSTMQVRTALKKLEKTQEITIEVTSKFSIITICKYDTYNPIEFENNTQNNNQITNNYQTNNKQITNNYQTNNKQITTSNKDKKVIKKESNKENKEKEVVCSNTGETANSTQPTDNNTQNNLKHDLEMLLNDEDLKSTFENQNFTYEQTLKKFEQYFKSNKRTTKTKGFEDTRKFYVWWSSKVLPTLKPINNNAPAAQQQRKIAAKEKMPNEWRKIVGRLTMFFQVRVDSFITTMEKFWIFCGSPENIDFQDGLSEIAQKFENYCQQGKITYKTLDQIDLFDSWFWIQEERNSSNNIKIA